MKKIAPVPMLSRRDRALFEAAWNVARRAHGEAFTFYLPGMVRCGRERGAYPAVSITGGECELQCEHCKGRLLEPMTKLTNPEDLIQRCMDLEKAGELGVLQLQSLHRLSSPGI